MANIPTLGVCYLRNINNPIYTNMLLVKLLKETLNLKKTGPTFSNKLFSQTCTTAHIHSHVFELNDS